MKNSVEGNSRKSPLDDKWTFVFKYGVLLWGVSTALFFQGFMYISAWEGEMGLLESLIVFPIGGFFWGLFMWYTFSVLARRNAHKAD